METFASQLQEVRAPGFEALGVVDQREIVSREEVKKVRVERPKLRRRRAPPPPVCPPSHLHNAPAQHPDASQAWGHAASYTRAEGEGLSFGPGAEGEGLSLGGTEEEWPLPLEGSRALELKRSGFRALGRLRRAWASRPMWLKGLPAECCPVDRNMAHTAANVITSVPLILVGLAGPRETPEARSYGRAVVGVGVSSLVYHASSGPTKAKLRWLDYISIAVASMMLNRALKGGDQGMLSGVSTAILPMQPLLSIALNLGAAEAELARKARKMPELRSAHRAHVATGVLGAALFVAEDAVKYQPLHILMHPAWHLVAAQSIRACRKLL